MNHIVKTDILVNLDRLRLVANKVHKVPYDFIQNIRLLEYEGGAHELEKSTNSVRLFGTRLQGHTIETREYLKGSHHTCEDVLQNPALFSTRNPYCVDYINDILDFFPESWKAIFWTLGSGYGHMVHSDPPERSFTAHVALETNPWCNVSYGGSDVYHIPVDGHVYLMQTHIEHTSWNHGDTSRTHFILRLPGKSWNKYATHERVTI